MIGFLTDPIRPLNIQQRHRVIVRKRKPTKETYELEQEQRVNEKYTINDDSYYAKFNSLVNGDSDVNASYNDCNIVITPSLKDKYEVMGTPCTFTYTDRVDRITQYNTPNYMKVILNNSSLYSGTIFESFYTLSQSEKFLASCNIGSNTTKTVSNVAPVDLGTADIFIRNVSNERAYATESKRKEVFGILMERFNNLIDKFIRNNYDANSEDAANEIVNTFFKVDDTMHKPYRDFIYTLLLPSMLLTVLSDDEKYKVFYYMGYLPSGSKCVVVDDNETYRSLENINSDKRPSDYSTMDTNSFAQLSTNESFANVLDGIELACNFSSDPIAMDSNDIVKLCGETSCGSAVDTDGASVDIYKTQCAVYTFPSDMTVYSYILKENASKFAQQIVDVIENSMYIFVAMNRFMNTCASTLNKASTNIDYVEPIIGFPVFRSVLVSGDEPYIISASSKQVGTTEDCRDISYDTGELNTLTKYARDMCVNGGGTYEYLNASTTLYSLVKYNNLDSGESLYYTSDSANNSSYTLKLSPEKSSDNIAVGNTARVVYNVDDEHFTFRYASADTVQYITKNTMSSSNLGQYSISVESDTDGCKALIIEYQIVESSIPSFLRNATYDVDVDVDVDVDTE